MHWLKLFCAEIGGVLLCGCIVFPAAPPVQRVVERDVVDANGVVVERERYEVDDVPPPVEVVTVAPYPGAVWVHGYWVRGYHRRAVWVHGYWR